MAISPDPATVVGGREVVPTGKEQTVWDGVPGGVVNATPLDAAGCSDTAIDTLLWFGLEPVLIMQMEVFMRRRTSADQADDGFPDAPEGMRDFPELWSFLSCTKWEEGTARTPGSITLFRDAGKLKAAFNDRDAGEVGFYSLDGLQPVLAQLETALLENRIDWRRQGGRARPGSR